MPNSELTGSNGCEVLRTTDNWHYKFLGKEGIQSNKSVNYLCNIFYVVGEIAGLFSINDTLVEIIGQIALLNIFTAKF